MKDQPVSTLNNGYGPDGGCAGTNRRGSFGVDLGWRWFSAQSSRPDIYDGELRTSSVDGSAGLLAVTYGIELGRGGVSYTPRLGLETSYPDFGPGGDGYSALHRESDLGFRASVGIEVKRLFGR